MPDSLLDDIRNKANAAYSKKNWQDAVALFGQAVDLEQDGAARATLLAKRSAAYIRLENFESGALTGSHGIEAALTSCLSHSPHGCGTGGCR